MSTQKEHFIIDSFNTHAFKHAYIALIISSIGALIAFLNLPLHNLSAAIFLLINGFPLVVIIWFAVSTKLERAIPETNAHSGKEQRPISTKAIHIVSGYCAIFSVLGIGIGYNKFADTSTPQRLTHIILEKNFHTEKTGKRYFVTIPNPRPPRYGFIRDRYIYINVHKEDYDKLLPEISSITIDVHQGRLGLAWTRAYEYTYNSLAALPKNLKEACQWADTFVPQNLPTPDSYERDFWPNGTPRSVIPIVNGKRNGIERDTFENGKLYGEIYWKDDLKHGSFTLYRKDGTKQQRLSFKNGQNFGISQWFDAQGNLTEAWLYLDDYHVYPTTLCSM